MIASITLKTIYYYLTFSLNAPDSLNTLLLMCQDLSLFQKGILQVSELSQLN